MSEQKNNPTTYVKPDSRRTAAEHLTDCFKEFTVGMKDIRVDGLGKRGVRFKILKIEKDPAKANYGVATLESMDGQLECDAHLTKLTYHPVRSGAAAKSSIPAPVFREKATPAAK